MLDVGCAAGYFLKVMAEWGWDGAGVEVSGEAVRFARESLGLGNIVEGKLAEGLFEPGSFDLVTFWDSIEHLADPLGSLRAARGLLKDDGLLLVETQNVESLFAKALGRMWQHYKYDEHLYHFSPGTLERLMEKAGFAMTRRTPFGCGKYVTFNFVIERSRRLGPLASRLASLLAPLRTASLYVNPMDEMLALGRKI